MHVPHPPSQMDFRPSPRPVRLAWALVLVWSALCGQACAPAAPRTSPEVPAESPAAPSPSSTPASRPEPAPLSAPAPSPSAAGTAARSDVGLKLTAAPERATLEARLEAGRHAWIEGDTLTFALRAPGAASVEVGGGVRRAMTQVEGTDLWAVSLQARKLDGLVLRWSFEVRPTPLKSPLSGVLRGTTAPRAASRVESVSHPVVSRPLTSAHLERAGEVWVYRAPGSCEGSPWVVMIDGQKLAAVAPAIEAQVLAGVIEPLVVIGVPDVAETGEDEPAHTRFVVEEVVPWAVETFGVARVPARRALYGASRGAPFAASVAVQRPDIFGHGVALSMTAALAPTPSMGEGAVELFLSAGTLEPSAARETFKFADWARAEGASVSLRVRVGGHDDLIWQEELLLALGQIFPNPVE